MLKRSRIPADSNIAAAAIVAQATGQSVQPATPASAPRRKNAAAVSLGRRGGKKGGRARAAKMTPNRRTEIARKAAVSRWSRRPAK